MIVYDKLWETLKARGIKQKDFIAKMQVMGCDMNPTSYSKLEGQFRSERTRSFSSSQSS